MTKRFTLAYETGNWWAVRDGDITLWKEEVVGLLNELNDENEQLKQKINEFEKQKAINCNNCQYFVSDCASSSCLKRKDIGYKGTCIDGMDLHLLALGCPHYG